MNKIAVFVFIGIFLFALFPKSVSPLSISVHVPEKYTTVNAGDRFYFEVDIKYPENPRRKDLQFEYSITDSEGNLISRSKALKAVETQASFVDFIVIPEDVKTGLYFINVKVSDYEALSQEVSSSFSVKEKTNDQTRIYFLILLIAICILSVLVITQMVKSRKK
jgi:hypothetical protein